MDVELRPRLNHKGVVCTNKNGKWSVECVTHLSAPKRRALAGIVCFSLGFSEPTIFNATKVNENGEILDRHRPSHGRNAYYHDYLHGLERQYGHGIYKRSADTNHTQEIITIETPNKECKALYLECTAHSHILTDDSVSPAPINPTTVIPEPITSQPDVVTTVPTTDLHPEHAHTTNATNSPQIPDTTTLSVIEDNFNAPWTASVYIDGNLACIGVLLDRQWVLVENSCVESIEYEKHSFRVVFIKSNVSKSHF